MIAPGVDHQGLQYLLELGREFLFEILQFSRLDEVGDVVIGEISVACLLEALADTIRDWSLTLELVRLI